MAKETSTDENETMSIDADMAANIAADYEFSGLNLPLGAVVGGEVSHPLAQVNLPLAMLNRHGLIAGATGTGKTRTLQLLAEGLSANGVSVFLADVKGDLSGLAEAGAGSDGLLERTKSVGQDWKPGAFPLEILRMGGDDLTDSSTDKGQNNGEEGTPVRADLRAFGPLMLAKVLELNNTQEQSLQLLFSWAKDTGRELRSLTDLREALLFLTGDGKDALAEIGGISTATAGVILRSVSVLESQGADRFFGAPAFDTADLLRKDSQGRGVISALAAGDLLERPALVSTFIMWLLDDLFSSLPEVGDQDKPKLVFFFDEAHLLFTDASDAFLDQVTRTVRLIRSKGVGVFFITQTPQDIPAPVLGQLGAKIMHALRVYTPKDAKMLAETVSTFPECDFDLGEVVKSLGTGEAIVTVLDKKGRPSPVAPTRLRAPASVMGPASAPVLAQVLASSSIRAKYVKSSIDVVDTPPEPIATEVDLTAPDDSLPAVSETEKLREQLAAQKTKEAEQARLLAELEAQVKAEKAAKRTDGRSTPRKSKRVSTSRSDSAFDAAVKSGLRSMASTLGRELTKFLFKRR